MAGKGFCGGWGQVFWISERSERETGLKNPSENSKFHLDATPPSGPPVALASFANTLASPGLTTWKF